MASVNVNLVRSIFAAWERGDFSSAEWARPEIEFVIVDGPAPGSWRGVAEMARAYRGWIGAFDEYRVVADEYRVLDSERVLVLLHATGRGKASRMDLAEMRFQEQGANLFHLRDGRVTRLVLFWHAKRALAHLGLAPETGSRDS
jgi:ketosteroid isomerase-like protein